MRSNPTGRFRFAPEPPIHNPADPVNVSSWLDRQFRAIGDAIDQTDQLDVATEPPPANESRVGMIRYLEDTPLGYGPGPYCYTCLSTGLPSPNDTLCFWRPMFPLSLGKEVAAMPTPVELTLADTWYDLFPATIDLAIRFGQRLSARGMFNAASIGGRQSANITYRVLVDGQITVDTFNPFWALNMGSATAIDFGETTTIVGSIDNQVSEISKTYAVQIQASSTIAAVVEVEEGYLELLEE